MNPADTQTMVTVASEIERLTDMGNGEAAEELVRMPVARRNELMAEVEPGILESWIAAANRGTGKFLANLRTWPEETLGRLMEPAYAVFPEKMTVSQAIEELRPLVKRALITYCFTVDAEGKLEGKLEGVVVMRDMLLADPGQTLHDIALTDPFHLTPETEVADAMKSVLNKHFPVYPVCSEDGVLLGLVRGSTLFEARAFELSAQAGSMVGVDKEERLGTSWKRSLRFRHPWLQLNLLTAFVAAAVVGVFEGTLEKVVLLAVFLPVLAGQSGNTGSQALAVALRAMTLGEFRPGQEKRAMFKEAILGLCNGVLVGITAGLGMFFYAKSQGNADATMLGAIVLMAMTGSCVISGVAGVIIPVVLIKFGADPATASSIFLTTATDVVSMGMFLGLATLLL